jgi:hypothetical protein
MSEEHSCYATAAEKKMDDSSDANPDIFVHDEYARACLVHYYSPRNLLTFYFHTFTENPVMMMHINAN